MTTAEQRMWARWYEQARKAYVTECKRRGVRQIDWRELPLIPLPALLTSRRPRDRLPSERQTG